jgi:hypothetical protein
LTPTRAVRDQRHLLVVLHAALQQYFAVAALHLVPAGAQHLGSTSPFVEGSSTHENSGIVFGGGGQHVVCLPITHGSPAFEQLRQTFLKQKTSAETPSQHSLTSLQLALSGLHDAPSAEASFTTTSGFAASKNGSGSGVA